MPIQVLIAGRLANPPEQRTATSGRTYVMARLAVEAEGGPIYVSAFAHDTEVQAVLLALGQGAEVAVSGSAKLSTWTNRDGQPMPHLTVTASAVLTLHEGRRVDQHVGRARAQARGRHGTAKARQSLHEVREQWQGDGLDDGRPPPS